MDTLVQELDKVLQKCVVYPHFLPVFTQLGFQILFPNVVFDVN